MAAIGVLRLIDQNMVRALVELVAYPLGHARAAQQAGAMTYKIVIIDRADPAFGRRIRPRICAPGIQALSHSFGVRGTNAQVQQFGDRLCHMQRQRLILRLGVDLALLRWARVAILLENAGRHILQCGSAHFR